MVIQSFVIVEKPGKAGGVRAGVDKADPVKTREMVRMLAFRDSCFASYSGKKGVWNFLLISCYIGAERPSN